MLLLYSSNSSGKVQELGISFGSFIADNFLLIILAFILIMAPFVMFHRIRIKKLPNKNSGS